MIVGIVGEVSRHMTIWGNFIFAGMEGGFEEREEDISHSCAKRFDIGQGII
jgi:hypothetical protein